MRIFAWIALCCSCLWGLAPSVLAQSQLRRYVDENGRTHLVSEPKDSSASDAPIQKSGEQEKPIQIRAHQPAAETNELNQDEFDAMAAELEKFEAGEIELDEALKKLEAFQNTLPQNGLGDAPESGTQLTPEQWEALLQDSESSVSIEPSMLAEMFKSQLANLGIGLGVVLAAILLSALLFSAISALMLKLACKIAAPQTPSFLRAFSTVWLQGASCLVILLILGVALPHLVIAKPGILIESQRYASALSLANLGVSVWVIHRVLNVPGFRALVVSILHGILFAVLIAILVAAMAMLGGVELVGGELANSPMQPGL